MGGPATAVYPMTKAAVLCLTESLYTHLEMTGARVRAHVLFPSGFLNTGIWESWRHRPERYAATQERQTPDQTLAKVVARFEAAGAHVEFTPLETLVTLHFFLDLQVKGLDRVNHALDFVFGQSGALQPGALLSEPLPLSGKPLHGFLIFRLVADHFRAPRYLTFTIPRGLPFRRDCRNADGNSSSCPCRSRMTQPIPGTYG